MASTEKDDTVSEPARFTEDELALIADKEFFRRKLEVSGRSGRALLSCEVICWTI